MRVPDELRENCVLSVSCNESPSLAIPIALSQIEVHAEKVVLRVSNNPTGQTIDGYRADSEP